MDPAAGAKNFQTSGAHYDLFMGRYSTPLASLFADAARVVAGQSILDVGCGPGALTSELVARLGSNAVSAVDPSPMFVRDCAERCPGVDVRLGRAEALPFDAAVFDGAMTQLVLHFVSDPQVAALELRRVVRPGGVVAGNVWDFSDGMEMLRRFWDAALAIEPAAPDEARTMRFGRQGEIVELFESAGLEDATETMLTVSSSYDTFEELWSGFLAGIGPAGAFCVSLSEEKRKAVREHMFAGLGSPTGRLSLVAKARCVVATVPK
jgi:SAM-dependent methyltransferase